MSRFPYVGLGRTDPHTGSLEGKGLDIQQGTSVWVGFAQSLYVGGELMLCKLVVYCTRFVTNYLPRGVVYIDGVPCNLISRVLYLVQRLLST